MKLLSAVDQKLPLWALLLGFALYFALDLAWDGPAREWLAGRLAGAVPWESEAARVNGKAITRGQLELATNLFLARSGQTRAALSTQALEATRAIVLQDLMDDERVRSAAAAEPLPVSEAVLEARVVNFESRFPAADLKTAMEAQGLRPGEMRSILREHARELLWLEAKTAAGRADGSEQELRAWHARWGERVRVPDAVRARHLFLSSVFGDVAAKERLVPGLLERLRSGGSAAFAELCPAYSEDERTKNTGGDLGYFTRHRVRPDFADAVFLLPPGEVRLVRSGWGWHLVRVDEKRPARTASWSEQRPEIAVLVENRRRVRAVEALLEQLGGGDPAGIPHPEPPASAAHRANQ